MKSGSRPRASHQFPGVAAGLWRRAHRRAPRRTCGPRRRGIGQGGHQLERPRGRGFPIDDVAEATEWWARNGRTEPSQKCCGAW